MNQKYRRLRLRLLRTCGNKCETCGKRSNLEFHHVNGNPKRTAGEKRGGYQNLLDIGRILRTDRAGVKLLCRPCHDKEG